MLSPNRTDTRPLLSTLTHGCEMTTPRGIGTLDGLKFMHGQPYAIVALPGGNRCAVPVKRDRA